jgi:hypothetical protein
VKLSSRGEDPLFAPWSEDPLLTPWGEDPLFAPRGEDPLFAPPFFYIPKEKSVVTLGGDRKGQCSPLVDVFAPRGELMLEKLASDPAP